MRIRIVLSIILSVAVMGIPLYAQHGHGGGGAAGGSMGHSMDHPDSNSEASKGSASKEASKESSVSDHLQDNTKLASKLQSLLPQGTNLQQAAQGFKNLGQFVAAVHVAHNLGIPFDQLKAKLMGPPTESLGKAIHSLKPDVKSSAEAKKGQKQAKQDMHDSKQS